MSEVKTPEELSAQKNGKEEKAEAEDLPTGWKTEVKIRKGRSGTKTDRYYTDPLTGYTFRSLKEVQRYLKTGELGRLAIKPKDVSGVDMDVETKKDENFVKKSPQPENVSEGNRKRNESDEKSKSELPQRASKRLAGVKLDAPPSSSPEARARPATRLAGIKIDAPPPPPPPEPKTRQAAKLARIKTDAVPSASPPEAKTRQASKLVGIKTDAPPSSTPEPKTRQATRLAGVKIDPPPLLPPETKARQATQSAGTKIDVPPLSSPEPKTRQAKRRAGIEVDASSPSPPEPKTRSQASARRETSTTINLATQKENNKKVEEGKSNLIATSDKHDGNADVDINPNLEQEILLLSPPVSQQSHKNVNEDFKVNEKQESHTVLPPQLTPSAAALPPATNTSPEDHPPANSDKPLEKQELPINPPVSNPIPQDQTISPFNFSMNDLWTDPCIEFAVKTLTGAIPFGDLNRADNFAVASPLEVPLEELWTDPCIEFAVKTLTGAIPVSEELCVQDYLQHQASCSSETRAGHSFSLPDVGMNSFCQTEVLSTGNKAPESVRNGGLQKSGNGVVPQQVKGSNGQCSRSRFFQ